MTYDDIIRHYGGKPLEHGLPLSREAQMELAKYGIYRQLLKEWQRKGVPELRQFQLYVLTGGKLKIDKEYY